MILVFLIFPSSEREGGQQKLFTPAYVLFLHPHVFASFHPIWTFLTQMFFSSRCRCLFQATIICHFRSPFYTFAGEKRSIILADYLCSCLECLCETEQRGIRAHKNTFSAESGNDRFKDEHSQAKLTETLFKRRPNRLISRKQRSWCWFIAGANKNLLISYKSEHCWDIRGRDNGVWLITLQTLGWHVHAHTRARTGYNPES